jgi:CheY-like chemotaxis protein
MIGKTEPSSSETRFEGKRVLVIEDEVLVAMIEIDMLEDLGVRPIGPVQSVQQALDAIDGEALDAALLDGNLGGAQVDAVAAALTRRSVPFMFVTGYSRESLPTAFRAAPILPKPFTGPELAAALHGLFGT